jgi:hypothetical protein
MAKHFQTLNMEMVKYNSLPVVVGANTKKEIETLADALVTDLIDKGSPLELAEMLSSTEHLVKTIKSDKRYSEYVQVELNLRSGKFSTESGSKIEACEVGTKYHFDKCGDVELFMLEQRAESANNAVKERQEFLKKVPASGLDVVDPISGEVYKVYPPYKTSTTSYKVTLSR